MACPGSDPLIAEHDDPMDIGRLSLVAQNDQERLWILDVFFTDAENSIRQMGYALQNSDRKLFQEMAHSLRGAAGNMGMQRLCSLCNEAMQAKHIHSKENKEIINKMCAEMQRIRHYLIKKQILPNHV